MHREGSQEAERKKRKQKNKNQNKMLWYNLILTFPHESVLNSKQFSVYIFI